MHRSGSEELGVAQFASAMSVPQNGAWSARFNTFPMAASLPVAAPLPIRCARHAGLPTGKEITRSATLAKSRTPPTALPPWRECYNEKDQSFQRILHHLRSANP